MDKKEFPSIVELRAAMKQIDAEDMNTIMHYVNDVLMSQSYILSHGSSFAEALATIFIAGYKTGTEEKQ